jgi:predicted ATPase
MGLIAAVDGGEFPLVEREAELAAVKALLTEACGGNGGLLFVSGPAGIGKTKLVGAARAVARGGGMAVFSGVGTEFEREYPFGVVKQCLASVLRRQDERERLLTGAARLAGPAVLDAELPADASAFGMLNGLYWLLAALADERPLVLLVDDAHWGDEPSMRFLGYLARRIESVPVAVIVASRSEVDFSGAPPALAAVRDHARAHGTLLELRPLAPAGVAEFLAAARGRPVEDRFALACHEATGGNPFLLDELMSSLSLRAIPFVGVKAADITEVSPPGIKRSVAATLGRVSPDARQLAHAIAVLGDGTDVDLAGELAGMTPPVAAGGGAEIM